MTTIAYRAGVLASDGRSTSGGVIDDDKAKKIWRLKDGSLFGASGSYVPGLRLLFLLQEAVKSKKFILPTMFLKCNGLLIYKKEMFYFERGLWEKLTRPYYAIGSGGPYARTAMDFGADAKEAVKAGISRDIYSGGRVQILKVG